MKDMQSVHSSDIKQPKQIEIYFEHQGMLSALCGVHCLNNVLGRCEFTKGEITQLCYTLSESFINPHKYIFGGQFDINVLMKAMESRGYEIKYLDCRRSISLPQIQESQQVLGYIFNIKIKQGGLLKKLKQLVVRDSRHWTALRKHGDRYWYLDSCCQGVISVGLEQDASRLVQNNRRQGNQVLVVVKLKQINAKTEEYTSE